MRGIEGVSSAGQAWLCDGGIMQGIWGRVGVYLLKIQLTRHADYVTSALGKLR